MTEVYIDLVASSAEFRVLSGIDEDNPEFDGFRREIKLQGTPEYTSTYKRFSLGVFEAGREIEVPSKVSFVIQPNPSVDRALGHLTYIDHWEDKELGIEQPTELFIRVNVSAEQFDGLWSLFSRCSGSKIKIGTSFVAASKSFGHDIEWHLDKLGGTSDNPITLHDFNISVRPRPNGES